MKIYKIIKSIILLEFLFKECEGNICCAEEKTGKPCRSCKTTKKRLILCYICKTRGRGRGVCVACKRKNNLIK